MPQRFDGELWYCGQHIVQPAHGRSCVAGFSAASFVGISLQPANGGSGVAGLSSTAVVRALVQPDNCRSCVAGILAECDWDGSQPALTERLEIP